MGDWLPISVFGKKSYFQEQITDIKWEMAVFLLIRKCRTVPQNV